MGLTVGGTFVLLICGAVCALFGVIHVYEMWFR